MWQKHQFCFSNGASPAAASLPSSAAEKFKPNIITLQSSLPLNYVQIQMQTKTNLNKTTKWICTLKVDSNGPTMD